MIGGRLPLAMRCLNPERGRRVSGRARVALTALALLAMPVSVQPWARPAPAPAAGQAPRAGGATRAQFHHLHLAALGPAELATVYGRLFQPQAIERGRFWGTHGIKGRTVYLLIDAPGGAAPLAEDSALWHFGWGQVSLGETYRDHYVKEVNWRPPYPALERDLHVHLRSTRPRDTADWYARVLGGEAHLHPDPVPEDERVDALVRFDDVALAIHAVRTPVDFPASRGRGRLDHLAFASADPSHVLRAAGDARLVTLRAAPAASEATLPAVFLAGPDGVAIEILRAPRGPAFWHR